MIDSLSPEFPRFVEWWERQHIAVRAVLAPPLLLVMFFGMLLLFVSAITWMPLVAVLAEIIGDPKRR